MFLTHNTNVDDLNYTTERAFFLALMVTAHLAPAGFAALLLVLSVSKGATGNPAAGPPDGESGVSKITFQGG
jgi:hypothetical protein